MARALLIGVAVFAAAIAAFVLVQHNSMFALFVQLARRVAPEKWLSVFAGRASAIDDAVVATYRRRLAFFSASVLRLVGWAAGAGETWLVMIFLGRPLSVTDAFVLESLSSGVRAAAFMVPGALGALEGGIVVFGALFGLPADMALGDFLVQTGPRAGVGSAGPRGLAVGRRTSSLAPGRGRGGPRLPMTAASNGTVPRWPAIQ